MTPTSVKAWRSPNGTLNKIGNKRVISSGASLLTPSSCQTPPLNHCYNPHQILPVGRRGNTSFLRQAHTPPPLPGEVTKYPFLLHPDRQTGSFQAHRKILWRCVKKAHVQECPAVGSFGPLHRERPSGLERLGLWDGGSNKPQKTCSSNQKSVQSLPTRTNQKARCVSVQFSGSVVSESL